MKKGVFFLKDTCTDYELISAIKQKDSVAEYLLIKRYEAKVYFIAREYAHGHKGSGISIEEYYSVGLSTIVFAAKKYNKNVGYEFITFLSQIVKNKLNEYDRKNSYLRGAKLFAGTESLDYINAKDTKARSMSETLGDVDPFIKGNVDYDDVMSIIKKVMDGRKEKERSIFALYLQVDSIKEVSERLNIPISSVYRIINSIEKELANALKQ